MCLKVPHVPASQTPLAQGKGYRRHPCRHAYNPPASPPSARSVDQWQTGSAWGRYPQSLPSIVRPLLAPPSTPGIVDKIPTFLGRSKGDTYTRSRLWAGLVLRDSPLGCYSTTIAHTHPHSCGRMSSCHSGLRICQVTDR